MKSCTAMLTILLFAWTYSPTALAKEKWGVSFQDVPSEEVLVMLEEMFQLTPSNPSAKCLKQRISYQSDRLWTDEEAKELVVDLIKASGCSSVQFDGNRYDLHTMLAF